jgi:hypothetical protein
MVKNTKGGKGAKSLARKSTASASGFPVPTNEFEQFAVVHKMFGPSCDVILLDGSHLLCHIRNKFKGRHKSGNLISVGSVLLIGLRDWEPDNARKNCDLLFVYDHLQSSSLAERFDIPSLLPSVSYDNILFDNTTTATHDTSNNTTNITTTITSYDSFFDL